MHLGIDFGARKSGNTAICFLDNDQLYIFQTEKSKDTDVLLKEWVHQLAPDTIFIDAPLSLPAAYFGQGTDFMYRQCDRVLGAMSPMFLGGLTARAIQFSHWLINKKIASHEVYPAALVKYGLSDLGSTYTKNLDTAILHLTLHIPYSLEREPTNWHQFDAVLQRIQCQDQQSGWTGCAGRSDCIRRW